MRILVTGGSGFIGTKLLETLSLNLQLHLLAPPKEHLDLIQSEAVHHYMETYKPDVIVHLAANPNNKPDDNNPNGIISDNIIGTHNVLYYAPIGCRFIFASSICVYGPTPIPPKENALRRPTSVYGATKSACEDLINVYTHQNRIRGVSLRLCATVGTGLTHGILYDFIRKANEPGEFLEVFGDEPGSIKPYIHISDVIHTILYMIDNQYITYPINVVPNGLLSVKDIANIIIKEIAPHKTIKWLGSTSVWRGDEQLLQANNTLAHSLNIPLQYTTSLNAMYTAILTYKRN